MRPPPFPPSSATHEKEEVPPHDIHEIYEITRTQKYCTRTMYVREHTRKNPESKSLATLCTRLPSSEAQHLIKAHKLMRI